MTAELAANAMWRPSEDDRATSRILDFARVMGCSTVPELTQLADEEPERFWEAVTSWLELDWQVEPEAIVSESGAAENTRWFPGGSFNIAENCVDRWIRRGRGDATALLWEVEDGSRGSWSFAELNAEVDALCHGLVSLGIEPGDRVGVQLPMIAESVVAVLACAKMGAVCVPVFSGFGGEAVAQRLSFAEAKAHIVAASVARRGREISLREGLAPALRAVSTLKTTVVVESTGSTGSSGAPGDPAGSFPGEVLWTDLLASNQGKTFSAYQTPTDHPLMIAFTSGSTGAPKGIVLSHIGFGVKAGSDAAFCFNLSAEDTASWITDPGWVMSPITVFGGLINGASVSVFGGAPDWPDRQRIWNFVRDTGVTMLGVSPTLVRLLMSGEDGLPQSDLPLKVLASSGEPWTPDAYRWLFEDAFESTLPIINYSGGTEVSGGILSNTVAEDIHPCGFAGPIPGMGADVVDDSGATLPVGVGELVLRNPSPGMPLTFWRDPERYAATYWERWKGIWHHGDFAERTADGVWYIRGRSDDTLKVAGKRVGPSEVESVVNGVTGIIESAAIGVPHPTKGDALVIFARHNSSPGDLVVLADTISEAVTTAMGKPLRPQQVHVVPVLPKTRSGKILRRLIRAAYLGDPPGDLASLDDPAAIAVIEATR